MLVNIEEEYIKNMWIDIGAEHFENKLRKYSFVNGILLDIGCGPGQWSVAASKYNKNVISIDSNNRFLEYLKNYCQKEKITNIKMIQTNNLDLLNKNSSYNFIVCYNMLQYVDQRKYINKIAINSQSGTKVLLGIVGLGYYLEKIYLSIINLKFKEFTRYFLIIFRSALDSTFINKFVKKKKERMMFRKSLLNNLFKNNFKLLEINDVELLGTKKKYFLGITVFYEILIIKK
jgi:SAM-dependent methyltransferase